MTTAEGRTADGRRAARWRRLCTPSCATRRCPDRGSTRTTSGPASRRSSTSSRRATASLLAARDELQRRLDEYHAATPGQVDQAAYEAVPARDRLPGRGARRRQHRDRPGRRRGGGPGRSSAGRPGPQRTVRRQRRQRAVGLALRRALRHRRDRRGRRTRTLRGSGAASYNPVRGAEVVARGRTFLDDALPAPQGQPRRRDALRRRRPRSARHAARRDRTARRPEAVRRASRLSGRARGGPAGPPRSARRDPGRPRPTRSARATPPGSRTCCWSRRSRRSSTSRTRWPRSTPRTRSRATAPGWS